jgi:hypothetical protein
VCSSRKFSQAGALAAARVSGRENSRFITEARHVHSTSEHFVQHEDPKMGLDMDGYR